MDPTGVVLGAAGLSMAGVVAHVVTRSAGRGGIEVNGGIGIRTRRTRSSPAAWEAGHRAASPFTLAACLVALSSSALAVLGVVLVATTGVDPAVPVAMVVTGYVAFLVVMVVATRAADRAAEAAEGTGVGAQ